MANAFKKAAVAKAPSKAKKEKHEFSDSSLNGAVEQWIKAKALLTQSEQDLAEAEATILPRAEEERVKASLEAGSNQTTVIVNEKLSVSQSKRYRALTPDALDGLNKIFGVDTGRLFKARLSIKVKDSVLSDEALTQKLVDAIGEDNIGRFFDVTETTEVTEAFHVERSTNPALADKANEAMKEGLVSPVKASVKLA